MSGAEFLMDRPRGGWSELVTTSELDLRLDAFEARFGTKLATLEHRLRSQTWVTISTVIAAMGVIVAAIRI